MHAELIFGHTGSLVDCALSSLDLSFNCWLVHWNALLASEVGESLLKVLLICADVLSFPVSCHVGEGADRNRAILWYCTEFRYS